MSRGGGKIEERARDEQTSQDEQHRRKGGRETEQKRIGHTVFHRYFRGPIGDIYTVLIGNNSRI